MSDPARIGDREKALWIALVALALGLRLAALGDRPFHHDESQVAYFSWVYWRDHDYEYDPVLHGPWMYMLTAATYATAGASDLTARLPRKPGQGQHHVTGVEERRRAAEDLRASQAKGQGGGRL